MDFLFKNFAKRIIIDTHPSRFTFTCAKDDFYLSVATFIYIENSQTGSLLLTVGEEIPNNQPVNQDVHRINVFDVNEPLPPKTTYSRDDLIQAIFQYGMGKAYEKYILPRLRPIVFITGADRFASLFVNTRETFRIAAKLAGAKEIIFDKTDL
jgi:hypothetical protein